MLSSEAPDSSLKTSSVSDDLGDVMKLTQPKVTKKAKSSIAVCIIDDNNYYIAITSRS